MPADRSRYLAALGNADRGDPGPLGEFLARAVLDNPLRVAAVRGRLKASKASDGTWRSSSVWVEEYVASRYKRGT